MLNKSIYIVIIFLFTASYIFPLDKNIKGIVFDTETNKPISNVVLTIKETSRIITGNDSGQFTLGDLEYGSYTFVLNHIGYEENISSIEINDATKHVIVFYMIPRNIELNAVIVSDYKSFSKFDDFHELSNVLKGKALQKQLGLSLASTLKNEAGLAMRSMGPAPSRPVIRGLGANRIVMSEDDFNTVDLSATSPDHAVTIDPFSVSRVEVIRGPKVLKKSSTTIGGVVNVVRNEIPEVLHDNLNGQIGFFGESVNKGYLASIILELPVSPISVRTEISKRHTDNLSTPIGELKNSKSKNLNLSLASSYIFDSGFIGLSFRRFDLDYGIPGGFVGAHPDGVDINIYKYQYNIKSKVSINNHFIDDLNFSLSRVFYRHKEFEASGAIGSEFEITNYNSKIEINHKSIGIISTGSFGITSDYKDFNIGGFVFTTPSKALNISSFLIENIKLDNFSFEFGARYDYNSINPIKPKNSNIGQIRNREFNTFSLSTSILYQQSEHVYFGANFSRSSRVPTIEELFSEGPHLAAYSYEIGNPNLKSEYGYGTELFIYHQFEDLYFNFTIFANDISNYIIPRNSGEFNYATLLPIYQTRGVSSYIYGFENRVDWNFLDYLQFSNSMSFTRGIFKNGKNLPQIPPFKGLSELRYKNDKLTFGLSIEWAAPQHNLDEFEEKTDGYTVMNLFCIYSFVNNKNTSNIVLNIDNLFNVEYRNHLSRVKSILPEAGINVRLAYKMYFHF